MDFENVNPLNIKLNKLSGNLLPLTSDDTMFSIGWRIYGAVVMLFDVIQLVGMISGAMLAPKIKVLQDSTVAFVVEVEVFFMLIRLHMHNGLLRRLIRKLNEILHVEDEIMRSVVRSTMKTVEMPLKLYWKTGVMAMLIWYCMSFSCIFKKKQYFYEDYRIAIAFSKQPFSIYIFLLGNFIGCIASVYIFVKKNALDIYIINILLLMTGQYRYTAKKLAIIMQQETPQNRHAEHRGKCQPNIDLQTETEIKALCRHHNAVIQMIPILKDLLSLNFSLLYLTNVFRFCFIGIMLLCATSPLEAVMVFFYMTGGLVQFYILCLCVQQLLEASAEVTDKAFHAKWYQFERSVKSTFLLMIIGNNLECKLSALEKLNLSLPSFMTVLNQSYTIALLFLRMK